MQLDSVDHIAIEAKDIDRAVAWYRDKFACDILYQDDTWAYLQFANIRIALVLPGQHPAHIAFEHAFADQFGELTTHRDGTRSLYIEDSESNVLEFLMPTGK